MAFAAAVTVMVPLSALSSAPSGADQTYVPLCQGGVDTTPVSGPFHNLTITGQDYVANGSSLTVAGNLIIAPGACLDAFSTANVNVGGNILVGKGSVLALGCSPGAIGPATPPCGNPETGVTITTHDTVGGNIVANQPYAMYLTADTIRGNVVSTGGGPGPSMITFPTKENTIGGNLVIEGWNGGWIGALRNNVRGNVIFSYNTSLVDPDSSEVVSNTVGGNLVCFGNVPAVQFGDSGGTPNTVGGHKVGQCASV